MNKLIPFGNHIRLVCHSLPRTSLQSVSIKTWNYGWKPGPVPETKDEMERAAKKYGIEPSDYKPYRTEAYEYGDYPDLEPIYYAFRDPYQYYEDYKNRRHFGEPVNQMYEAHQVLCRLGEPHQESLATYCLKFIKVSVGVFLLTWAVSKIGQFPGYGRVQPYEHGGSHLNYSFAFEDEEDYE